jgi:Ras-related protein Rab-5C/Ras-related protein Rab-22
MSMRQEVTRKTAEAYAEEIGALFMETSAKDDTNVHNVFAQISEIE